jgi:hypothetical protein
VAAVHVRVESGRKFGSCTCNSALAIAYAACALEAGRPPYHQRSQVSCQHPLRSPSPLAFHISKTQPSVKIRLVLSSRAGSSSYRWHVSSSLGAELTLVRRNGFCCVGLSWQSLLNYRLPRPLPDRVTGPQRPLPWLVSNAVCLGATYTVTYGVFNKSC